MESTQRIAATKKATKKTSRCVRALLASFIISSIVTNPSSYAQSQIVYDTPAAIEQGYRDAERLENSRNYFQAAALYFNVYTAGSKYQDQALGKVAETLIKAGLPNAASYFFIKTLESGNKTAIRGVLRYLPALFDSVGGDLFRKYILRNTTEADYDTETRNHFFYFLGKDELLKGSARQALDALNRVSGGSSSNSLLGNAYALKGTAYAILGQSSNAVQAFQNCRKVASRKESRIKSMRREGEDLEARCTASIARSYYQAGNYEEADEYFDEIPKASFVWTDILFEQAWNAYAQGNFNRALGKLVTYRSPSLNFSFNPEVEVLRAQSFLSLCLYDDVNSTVNEFNKKYADVGGQIKNFLLRNERNLPAFYSAGKSAYYNKLHTASAFNKSLNRFVRGPYFASMLHQEKATNREAGRIHGYEIAASRERMNTKGFSSFLSKVLGWRGKSIQLLGGAFVKNSLYDQYQDMLANFDKISYIKLDMLAKAKSRLQKPLMSENEDGVLKKGSASIDRKDYQYFFTFNGEFWSDELGDYVFALQSECEGS